MSSVKSIQSHPGLEGGLWEQGGLWGADWGDRKPGGAKGMEAATLSPRPALGKHNVEFTIRKCPRAVALPGGGQEQLWL